jgi:DNA polymerase/3'-5' exonuclease PolX
MLNAEALKIAMDVMEILKPACSRMEVKGSISRLAAHVKDIEILAIPDLTPLPLPKPEFGNPNPIIHKTKLDELIYSMRYKKEGESAPWLLGKNGDKYKQIWLYHHSLAVDLFLVTPPAQWGVQAVIRTGPADFSHWMVTTRSQGGALLDEYIVQDGVVGKRVRSSKGYAREGAISMPEEVDFFRLCGMDWVEPCLRVARWKR